MIYIISSNYIKTISYETCVINIIYYDVVLICNLLFNFFISTTGRFTDIAAADNLPIFVQTISTRRADSYVEVRNVLSTRRSEIKNKNV